MCNDSRATQVTGHEHQTDATSTRGDTPFNEGGDGMKVGSKVSCRAGKRSTQITGTSRCLLRGVDDSVLIVIVPATAGISVVRHGSQSRVCGIEVCHLWHVSNQYRL